MSDITVGGHEFVIGRMDARRQFHVARRLGPLLSLVVLTDGGADALKKGALASLPIQPIAEALAQMSDADADYILDACLTVVQIRQEGRLSPIFRSGNMMFDWITMPQMLQITSEVIMQDLKGFFPGVPSPSPVQPAA